ncbi:hypothetical protein J2S43_003325 [Catenuloplanes nepalensis]|uniref:Roadblock/LAMTOR2 domain-containing protein n=1 Tax=Catenuloplanes nepalensis TaxID=587533 RepID=A0ABT9MTP8_9ACTN|nr:hypothetical protein [Catenuloplanes nepalensis]MDP9794813.1 hypothetical protein [Catenuloplanes nepalensis]
MAMMDPADVGGAGDHPIRALADALHIPGARRVTLVAEGASAPAWSSTPGGPDEPIEGAATVAVVMVQAARELLRLTAGGDVDDLLLTSGDYFHVLRLIERPGRGAEIVHLTLQRSAANLAMARHEFRRAAAVYRDGPYAIGSTVGPAGLPMPPATPPAPVPAPVDAEVAPQVIDAEPIDLAFEPGPSAEIVAGEPFEDVVERGQAIGVATVVPMADAELEPPPAPPAHVFPDFAPPPPADVPLLPPAEAPDFAYPPDLGVDPFGTDPFPPAPPGFEPLRPRPDPESSPYGQRRRPGAFLEAQAAEDAAVEATQEAAAYAAEDAAARAVLEAGYAAGYQEPDAAWPGYVPPGVDFPVSGPPPYPQPAEVPPEAPWPGETMPTSAPTGPPPGDTLEFADTVGPDDAVELLPRRTAREAPVPEPDPGPELLAETLEGEAPSLFSLLNQPFFNDSPTLDRIMSALRNL